MAFLRRKVRHSSFPADVQRTNTISFKHSSLSIIGVGCVLQGFWHQEGPASPSSTLDACTCHRLTRSLWYRVQSVRVHRHSLPGLSQIVVHCLGVLAAQLHFPHISRCTGESHGVCHKLLGSAFCTSEAPPARRSLSNSAKFRKKKKKTLPV